GSPAAGAAARAGRAPAERSARPADGRSASGEGSRLQRLPFLSDKTVQRGKGIRVSGASAPEMPTVLIVDDDASLRLLCRVNLELDGYNVLEAPSVAAAEDALAIDVVV